MAREGDATGPYMHGGLQASALALLDGSGFGGPLDARAAALNRGRLTALLEAFGEYPAKYRLMVW